MPGPRLSVALATYNGEKYLAEQLQSLAEQTRLPDELVVSDDGSTDATLAVVRAFAATAPFPVRVLDKPERLGFADNFLHAAEHCAHELVAFCDQDDVWLPRKLERMHARMVADQSVLSIHPLTLTDAALRPTGRNNQGITNDAVFEPLQLRPHTSVWGNTMLFRRELAKLLPREQRPRQPNFDRLLSHDHWIMTLASSLGRVSHDKEPLILYRQHADNVFGVQRSGLGSRLRSWAANPLPDLVERKRFNDRLIALFEEMPNSAVGEPEGVQRAIARFGERRRFLSARIATYDGSGSARRLSALLSGLQLPSIDGTTAAERARVAAKDALLGASGFARRNR